MSITLPPLPYDIDALEPYISKETLEYHYGKHHQGYVNKLHDAIKGTQLENSDLETIVKQSTGGVFNNAAQVWNHTFYRESMTPEASTPGEKIRDLLEKNFGSMENFFAEFKNYGLTNFASGWTWLVQKEDDTLEIINTDDAETALTRDVNPLLVLDIWEHAYYIDQRNDRGAYIDQFLKIINWEKVEQRLK